MGLQNQRHASVKNMTKVQPRLVPPSSIPDESAGQARMADQPRVSAVVRTETGEADQGRHKTAGQAPLFAFSSTTTHST